MTDEELRKDFEAWWKEKREFYGERDEALVYRGYVVGRKHTAPAPQIAGPVGWICPKCGAGNAPFTSRCGCVGWPKLEVTC